MREEKIILVDYIGQSNSQGIPVGHTVKTTKEMIHLLDQIIEVELVAPKNYEKEYPALKPYIKFCLGFYTQINIKNIHRKCVCFIGKILNLVDVFKNIKDNEGILWFINSDFLLYVFVSLPFFKKRNKMLLTLYRETFNSSNILKEKMNSFFFRKARRKFDLVIKNSEKIGLAEKELFLPVYVYNKAEYDRYVTEKKDHVLCIGIMNNSKDLINLAAACQKSGVKLKIIGFFPDKNLLREIKKYSNKKIEIQDRYLPHEEYYRHISEAKFCVLPYLEAKYNRRTSGILLESIFLNTIVIAPHFLLKFSNLPGIGYESLGNINPILEDLDIKKLEEIYFKMKDVRENFSRERISGLLEGALKNVSE